ncbi:hypothetical protein BGZ54_001504 [Gamsiella multidivaricata]|nr:hypothetical protein BGZ54_001504 [Gamsiella multidivaricata]
MDLLGTHLQESARRAAGSFLSPLTNAIGEQRRLVESLAVVSKVRVEECKHMMVWSKSQTDDLGDVLLKLNLLIRKISDYEIRFGTQYESFREKVKYLRTKDDSLCEMGRRQSDLQNKILDASKSRLRSAKALLLQKELDDIQKASAPTETKLQKLKREVIKGAYTEQLNAIIELGRKMQIIGEHGKQLLEHIDLPASIDDGRKTEDILQAARIALENWDQFVMVDPHSVVVHPPPPPPRSMSNISIDNIQTLAVSESQTASIADSGSDSDSESDQDYVAAPSTPLKSKPSVALTLSQDNAPSEEPETPVKAVAEPVSEPEPEQAQEIVKEEEEEEEGAEDPKTPRQEMHLSPFASTLVPKLTLTPSKPKAATATPVPARTSDWAYEAAAALASVQGKKLEDLIKEEDTSTSEAETLRRLEELEIKQALELSLAEASKPAVTNESGDLQLTAEELRFVMGDVVPKRSTKIVKRQARAPETTDGSAPVSVMHAGSRRASRAKSTKITVDTEKTASETESEQDLETPKASKPPRVVRGPQGSLEEGNRMSQQGPRPWIPKDEDDDEDDPSETSTVDLDGPEELANASDVAETMGEEHVVKPSPKKKDTSKVHESMGSEPERPLESMGPEPERPLESMGREPERPLESMGDDGPEEPVVPFVPMPQLPAMDQIRQQKIMERQQQQQHQAQQLAAFGVSPKLQSSPQMMNQQLQGSPQTSHSSLHASSPAQSYQSPIPYKPSTAYVPQTPKQKNRLSGSHQGTPGSSPQPQYQQAHPYQHQPQQSGTYSAQYLQQQQQQQQQYQRQQQQQLQDFYYSPFEQEYQQQQYQMYHQQLREQRQQQRLDSVSSVSSTGSGSSASIGIAPLGWSLPGMAPPQVTDDDVRYYSQHHQQQQQHKQQQFLQQQQQLHKRTGSAAGSSLHGGDDYQSSAAPSPSPSHISLIPDNTPSPVMASIAPLTPQKHAGAGAGAGAGTGSSSSAGTSKPALTPHPDDYKVEVK